MIINSRKPSGAALMFAKFARIRLRTHATNPRPMRDPHGSWMSLRGYQRTQREPSGAPMRSFPINELTEVGPAEENQARIGQWYASNARHPCNIGCRGTVRPSRHARWALLRMRDAIDGIKKIPDP